MSEHSLYINREIYRNKKRNLSISVYEESKISIDACQVHHVDIQRWEHRGFKLNPTQALGMAGAILNDKRLKWKVKAQNGVWWCKIEIEYKKLYIYDCSCSGLGLPSFDPFIFPTSKLLVGILAMWAGSKMIETRTIKSRKTELKLTDKIMLE